MKTANRFGSVFFEERGAVAVIVAILAVVLIGFAAFAVDLPNLMVARNELQNAADAGALAGGRFLYVGPVINTGANAIASDAAMANFSQKSAVEVESVERGHWSFGLGSLPKGFTANPSTAWVELTGKTTEELDGDLNFINALRVRVQRSETQVPSFFARIFGYEGFESEAEATAFLGFVGTFDAWAFDQPIAICRQSIIDGEAFTCNVGRMINSGGNIATSNTSGWTNFTQPCQAGNADDLKKIVNSACGGGGANANPVVDEGLGTTGGQEQSTFDALLNCWMTSATNRDPDGNPVPLLRDEEGTPIEPWNLRLPVIDCPDPNVGPCSELRGGVVVEVVWIQRNKIPESKLTSSDPNDVPCEDIPCRMRINDEEVWENDDPIALNRWKDFVETFNLEDPAGNNVEPNSKTIYFKPSCKAQVATGGTGGENYGVLADRPVLVN